MREICKLSPDGMNNTDNNFPTIFQKITFNIFSNYFTTRQNNGGGFLPKSSYSGVISAFVCMHRMSGETIPEEFKIEISQFMSGMNWTVKKG